MLIGHWMISLRQLWRPRIVWFYIWLPALWTPFARAMTSQWGQSTTEGLHRVWDMLPQIPESRFPYKEYDSVAIEPAISLFLLKFQVWFCVCSWGFKFIMSLTMLSHDVINTLTLFTSTLTTNDVVKRDGKVYITAIINCSTCISGWSGFTCPNRPI